MRMTDYDTVNDIHLILFIITKRPSLIVIQGFISRRLFKLRKVYLLLALVVLD